MSDTGFARRKQQLLDKFLAGEIDKATYDSLLADLLELGQASSPSSSGVRSAAPSTPSFSVTESRTAAEHSAYSQPLPLLESGAELGGFRLVRRLSRGGMGEVWQAHDATAERMVVIKVLPPELQRNTDEMARVKQTFNRVHSLQHQHICPVYLLGQDQRFGFYIVMKYIDGVTLSAYRKEYVEQNGSFPLRELVNVLMPVARALDYAHSRQIIHRDIKPQNIMLSKNGRDVQLVDFGLAAEVRTSVLRGGDVPMETCGTYPYMAPEQWRGEVQDARTDQYGLAVVAFELLAGRLPYEGTDPVVLRMCVLNDAPPSVSDCSAEVNAVLSKAMSKLRSDRFSNCVSFIESLAELADESTLPATEPPRARSSQSAHEGKFGKSAPVPLPSSKSSSFSSRPLGKTPIRRKSDDEFADDLEILDESALSEETGNRKSTRQRPGVRAVQGEAALKKANARAVFWISMVCGSMFVMFVCVAAWIVWAGTNLLASRPAQAIPQVIPETPKTEVAANNSAVPATVVPPEKKNEIPLRYGWDHGKSYLYSVNLELEPDDDLVLVASGTSTYTRGQPIAKKDQAPESGKGTGTGFVVHPSGYLVTCQHVVDDASEIEVVVGNKKYPAKVVIEDIEHDLAIIKIDAANLPVLALSNSDKVQLGEEVRAIGFPFSSILGDNIKATRGTISGINQEEERRVFQVDAGINPGNSGGPLVNEKGEVIGVNFAKMREEVATNVGFAVPVNDAIELLQGQGIEFTRGDAVGAKLDGPELVKKVAPATVLITVTTGGGAGGGLHHFELRCQGSLSTSARTKSGKAIDWGQRDRFQREHMSSIVGSNYSEPCTVETDAIGRVHDIAGGRHPLPAFLGSLGSLVLEHLPSTPRKTWSHTFPITVVISEDGGEGLGMAHRFRPRIRPPGFPFPGAPQNVTKTTRFPGRVRITYSVQETGGDLIKIKKEYDLEAREFNAKEPRVHMTGSGTFQFDVRTGIPRELEFAGLLAENEAKKSTKLPFKLTYQFKEQQAGGAIAQAAVGPVAPGLPVEKETALAVGTRLVAEWAGKWLPVDVLEVLRDGTVRIHWVGWGQQFDENLARTRLRFPLGVEPPQAVAAVNEVQAEAPAAQKLTKAEIEQHLEDLKGANAGKASLAAAKLQNCAPLEECRRQVLQVLEEALKDKDPFRRKQAIDALANWSNAETVPVLIRCLDDAALLVKLAAIEALGRLKDQRSAEPLARLVAEPGPRIQAVKSLQSLGAAAEPAVTELLKHEESEVRCEACRILKEIGTQACEAALQTAAQDVERTVSLLAKEALAAIAKRK